MTATRIRRAKFIVATSAAFISLLSSAASGGPDWNGELRRADQALIGSPAAPGNPLKVPDIKMAQEILTRVVLQAPVAEVVAACKKLLPVLSISEAAIQAKCADAATETGNVRLMTNAGRSAAEEQGSTSKSEAEVERLLKAALANGDFKAALALAKQPGLDPKAAQSFRAQAEMLAMRQAENSQSAAIYVDQRTVLAKPDGPAADQARSRLSQFVDEGSREALAALREIGRQSPAAAPWAAAIILKSAKAGSADAAQFYVEAFVDDQPNWTDERVAGELASLLAGTGRVEDYALAILLDIRMGRARANQIAIDQIIKRAGGDAAIILDVAKRFAKSGSGSVSLFELAFTLAENSATMGNFDAALWAAQLVERNPGFAGQNLWKKAVTLTEAGDKVLTVERALLLAQLRLADPSGEPDIQGARQALEKVPDALRSAEVWESLAGIAAADESVSAGREAEAYYRKAIAAGSAKAMAELGLALTRGRPGIPIDLQAGRNLLDAAVNAGETGAMAKLAKTLAVSDPSAAKYLFLRAVQAGDLRAGAGLSEILEGSGDLAGARQALENAAAGGEPDLVAALAAFQFRTGAKTPAEVNAMLLPLLDNADRKAVVAAAKILLKIPSAETEARTVAALTKLARSNDADAVAELAQFYVSRAISGDGSQEAEVWSRKAAQMHRPDAAVQMSKWLLSQKAQQERGIALLRFLLEDNPGDPNANRMLGDILAQGDESDRNVHAAFARYEVAAKGGSVGAKLRLARAYEFGSGTKADTGLAIELYSQAASAGSLNGMRDLGRLLVSAGSEADPGRGFDILYSAAKAGQVESQAEVGRLLLTGLGILRDEEEGLRWLEKAVQGGDVGAMLDLFHFYRRSGGEGKVQAAIELLTKASNAGSDEAMFILGMLYRDGEMVKADSKMAQYWLRKSASSGGVKAVRASKQLDAKYSDGD
jgi:TPR repeat protein